MIGNDVQPPIICSSCGADEMGCQVKAGLSGRHCCDRCIHTDREDAPRGGQHRRRRA